MGNFVIFILVLFALAALLRIDFFFTILYLFAGVYILSRLWSRRMLRNLVISRSMEQRAFLGERVNVTLTLENRSRLPIPWLLLNESFSTVLSSPPFFREVITLGGQATHRAEYTLMARRRGYYEIGPTTVETGDLLGLTRKVNGRFEADHLIVYPKILPISQLGLPTHSPQVILPTTVPLFHDATRISGVRPYVPGDNPRHIHWPATATSSQILVKQFQTAIARENAIFLNLNRNDYGRPGQASMAIELAIVVAASLAHHVLVNEDLPLGLFTAGFDPVSNRQEIFQLFPNRGRGHLMQLLEVLARVEASDDKDFLKQLQQQAVHLSWGTTIVIITSTQSDTLTKNILLLKRSGFRLALVLVQPAAYTSRSDVRAQALDIPTFKVRREKDVEAWLAVP
jgi:uncharacterized protein (DUF58 family)